MPPLRLFGRKWLVASDDLVFPGLFELAFRFVWLSLTALATSRYYGLTWHCSSGGDLVRAYLLGLLVLLSVILLVTAALVNRSAQGAIMDTAARRMVAPLLALKILLIIPEVAWNIMGTIWIFSDVVQCSNESFTEIVIEGLVFFSWILLGLSVFGLALVFDPLGRARYGDHDTPVEAIRHKRVTGLWARRLRWLLCCVRRDERSREAIQQVAALLSDLFRSTDMTVSDFMAGFILLRVKQKRETREQRRQQLLLDETPKAPLDVRDIFAEKPKWMTLELALHYLKYAMSIYGWPFAMYRWPFTGLFRLTANMSCCSCLRSKYTIIKEDNCCLCNVAAMRHIAKLSADDLLYASFENEVFQSPFCVIADHETNSIVIVIRGSMSLRDLFTDLNATADKFEAEGIPENSMAHRGMIQGALYIKKCLEDKEILDKAFHFYPDYSLVITGHSLGTGIGVLLALLLRPKYPDLRVYCVSPAPVLTREAARVTEEFTFSFSLGDDFVLRLAVDSTENLRNNLLQVVKSCRLPKYRVMLNGFGYALFGVPSRDLEATWSNDSEQDVQPSSSVGHLPLLESNKPLSDISILAKDWSGQRLSPARLFVPGQILHIMRRKRTKTEKKSGKGGPKYLLRWASPEDFTELLVMPQMILDHLPERICEAVETVLQERGEFYQQSATGTQL